VLAFVLLENIAWLIEPTFFGKLLDALINDFYHKTRVKIDYILPLIIWVGIYLLNTLGGTLSRYYSGKVYSQMYVDIATDVIVYSHTQGHPAPRAMARAELAKEYIIFFKDRLPEVTWQITATLGVIFALFFYDWRIALVCFAVIFPLTFILNIYRKNVHELQKDLHDSREDLYKFFEERNVSGIQGYYQRMVTSQTSISKWNSLNYSITKLLMMIIFIVVLFICVDVDKFSTGNIYAIVSYLWTFILSTDYLPGLMESATSISELNSRLGYKDD
jgi:ABC-type multidrug transport system fused ATPase/permease subunit